MPTDAKDTAKPKEFPDTSKPLTAMARSFIWDTDRIVVYPVPDPGAAAASLLNIPVMRAPKDLTIKKVTYTPHAAWIAAAPANDGAVTLKRANAGTPVVSLSVVTALAAASVNDMGVPDATTSHISEGQFLTLDVVANGTANAPVGGALIIEYQYDY